MKTLPVKDISLFTDNLPLPSGDVEVLSYLFYNKLTNHFHRIKQLTEGICVVYDGNPFELEAIKPICRIK